MSARAPIIMVFRITEILNTGQVKLEISLNNAIFSVVSQSSIQSQCLEPRRPTIAPLPFMYKGTIV